MLLMILLYVTGFHLVCVNSKKCATFKISLPSMQFDGEENRTMNFTFTLVDFHCESWDSIIILVSKFEARKKYFEHKCRIHHTNASCISAAPSLCPCLSQNKYLFNKTLHRSDNTQWRLSTEDGSAHERIIQFNVIYPAIVNSLTIAGLNNSKYVEMSTRISVACSWENGNPPTTLRLLDMNDKVIERSTTSGTVTHQLSVSSCYDNGAIRCEAHGSITNRSSLLVAYCPPEFGSVTSYINAMDGQSASINFPIRSYTTIFLQCQLTLSGTVDNFKAHSSGVTNRTYSCNVFPTKTLVLNASMSTNKSSDDFQEYKCHCIFHGLVPDFVLTVNINDITGLDFGYWQVLVSNPIGSGSTTLCIQESEAPPVLGRPYANIVNGNIGQKLAITLPISPQDVFIRDCLLSKYIYTDQHDGVQFTVRLSDITYRCTVTNVVPRNKACTSPSETSFTVSGTQGSQTTKCSCVITALQSDLILNLLIFNVTIQDGGRWCLTVSNKHGTGHENITIQLNSAPPLINELTLNGSTSPMTVSRNQSVLIECTWDNGFPPTTVRLIDAHANLLVKSRTDQTIRHQFTSVDCSHSGEVHCEAYRSTRNETVMLLVRCPPKFIISYQQNISTYVGNHVQFSTSLISHTLDITGCRIIKLWKHNNTTQDKHDSGLSSKRHDCVVRHFSAELMKMYIYDSEHVENHEKCACVLNGTVPNLILTLHVFHVNLYEGGRWKLMIDNEEGQDSLIIILSIDEFYFQSTPPAAEIMKQNWVLVVTIVPPLSLVAVVIGVYLYIAYKRKIGRDSAVASDLGFSSSESTRFQGQSPQNDSTTNNRGPVCPNDEFLMKISDQTFQSPSLRHIPICPESNYETVKIHQGDNEPVVSIHQGERDTKLIFQFTISSVKSTTEKSLRSHESVNSAYLTPCSVNDTNRVFMPSETRHPGNHLDNNDTHQNSSSSKDDALNEHHISIDPQERNAPFLLDKSSLAESPPHYDLCVISSNTDKHPPLTSDHNLLNKDYQSLYELID